MELSKNFEHSAAEQKWYKHWKDKKYFNSWFGELNHSDIYFVYFLMSFLTN